MTVANLIAEVQSAGGKLWCELGQIKYRLPPERTDLIEKLRAYKSELLQVLNKSFEQPTVWELLQNDWQTIAQVCKEAQDTTGLAVVMTQKGGTCESVRLDQPNTLKNTLAKLAHAHPAPLEIQVLAIRNDHVTLRARYRKTMLPNWVSA